MIDGLVSLADKVTELLEYRDKRAQLRYQTAVGPMHESLMAVHGDYLKILESCAKGFREMQRISEVADKLELERTVNEPLRRDLSARIKTLGERFDDGPYGAYFIAAGNYLAPWRIEKGLQAYAIKHQMASSTSRSLLMFFREAQHAGIEASPKVCSFMSELIESQLQSLRENWDEVAISHARVQASLIR